MTTRAALMTGKGAAAISCIEVVGDSAASVVGNAVTVKDKRSLTEPGKICLAKICEDKNTIDHAVVACESQNDIVINCHGNPIIVEMTMKLLREKGAQLVTDKELLEFKNSSALEDDKIKNEASCAHIESKTFEGAQIILSQTQRGLKQTAKKLLEENSIEKIKAECKKILKRSEAAHLIIHGANVMIVGAPNSGKSTLLNQLCGRTKAIVADIEGTTRDWVSATCKTEKLSMELFDTAGLDEALQNKTELDKISQQKSIELFSKADIVVLLKDCSKKSNEDFDVKKIKSLVPDNTKTICVYNKIDLSENFSPKSNTDFDAEVCISAATGKNIDLLIEKIQQVADVENLNPNDAVCFTKRQKNIVRKILEQNSKEKIEKLILELAGRNITAE